MTPMAEKAKVLVVDDDTDFQEFCKVTLTSAGHAVAVAASGAEGREAMGREKPDLVILDVMMESADAGFDAARWFAANHPQVPVLMLSSIADAADRQFDTSSLAVADLVNKPIAPADLLARVARLLERRK